MTKKTNSPKDYYKKNRSKIQAYYQKYYIKNKSKYKSNESRKNHEIDEKNKLVVFERNVRVNKKNSSMPIYCPIDFIKKLNVPDNNKIMVVIKLIE